MSDPTCGAPLCLREIVRRAARALIGAFCGVVIVACAAPLPESPARPAGEERGHAVHVVSHGWHSGIVVDRAFADASGLLPEAADFPDARFLEFGWGDRDFYMATEESPWLALKAALAPTPAVMHVAALARPPVPSASVAVVRLPMSEPALRQLIGAVSASFDRPEGGPAAPLGPGLQADSRFYPATGQFHLFETCNTWTARMLSEAGVPISAAGVVTAPALMRRVRAAAEGRRTRPAHGGPGPGEGARAGPRSRRPVRRAGRASPIQHW